MNISFHPASETYLQTFSSSAIVLFKILRNIALFVLVALIGIYGSVRGHPLKATIVAFMLFVTHIAGVEHPLEEASVIIIAGFIGALVELVNAMASLYSFHNVVQFISVLPTWIVFTWFAIGATARHSFSWLTNKPLIAAVTGVGLGLLVYHTAATVGAISLIHTDMYYLFLVAAPWAIAFPLTVLIGERFFETE